MTCATELYDNLGQRDPLQLLSPGEQVAAYDRANSTTLQVYDYSSNTAGFPGVQLRHRAPVEGPDIRVHRPAARQPHADLPPATAAGLRASGPRQLDRLPALPGQPPRVRRGNYIRTRDGVHRPFLGATVVSDGYTDEAVFVRVRTTRLETPLTLLITAHRTT